MLEINLGNFVSVGVAAFIFVWVANRLLAKAGLTSYEA